MNDLSSPHNHPLLRPNMIGIFLSVVVVAAISVLFWRSQRQGNGAIPLSQREATVRLTSSGFIPEELQVKAGTTVKWVNDTNDTQSIDASPYPTHTTLPQLVSGNVRPQGTYSFTFSQPGSWTYQDDKNPVLSGMVSVK